VCGSVLEKNCETLLGKSTKWMMKRPARSLELKWSAIKCNIAKFCGVYNHVLACNESGVLLDDVFDCALKLNGTKHAKGARFVYIYY
jgi:hypothetical protein